MQQKNKKQATYSPLRSRAGEGNGALGGQRQNPLDHPVLFKNSSIDGSKDPLNKSRSRSKSSEKALNQGYVPGFPGASLRTNSNGAKNSLAANGQRKNSSHRIHSGERQGLHSQGLKFIRPNVKNSARESRSPVDGHAHTGSGAGSGIAQYLHPS